MRTQAGHKVMRWQQAEKRVRAARKSVFTLHTAVLHMLWYTQTRHPRQGINQAHAVLPVAAHRMR